MSSVYRQTSTPQAVVESADPMRVDPDNQLLWHMRVRRLSSEAIRDSVLATSGILDLTMGGPSVNTEALADGRVVVLKEGQKTPTSHWRRSIYTLARRNFYPTLMNVFDQPTMVANCTQRNHSAVVLQSLTLLNDEFVLEQADHFSERILREARGSPEDCIERAFRVALARKPTSEELQSSMKLLHQQTARYRATGIAQDEVTRNALACLCQVLFNTSEFLYVE